MPVRSASARSRSALTSSRYCGVPKRSALFKAPSAIASKRRTSAARSSAAGRAAGAALIRDLLPRRLLGHDLQVLAELAVRCLPRVAQLELECAREVGRIGEPAFRLRPREMVVEDWLAEEIPARSE